MGAGLNRHHYNKYNQRRRAESLCRSSASGGSSGSPTKVYMMTILYKPIPGYPNYLVGTDGSVISEHTGKLKEPQQAGIYVRYGISRDGKQHWLFAHRLVLLAFRGPCPPGMQSRHLDGNGKNNELSNLCWGTPKQNRADQKIHGTHRCKLTESDILLAQHLFYVRGLTQIRIAAFLGVSDRTLRDHIPRIRVSA